MAHRSYKALQARLTEARKLVEEGANYYHYKTTDHFYTVRCVALAEATQKPCVVYESSASPGLIWVRDLDDWLSTVTLDDDITVPRFRKLN